MSEQGGNEDTAGTGRHRAPGPPVGTLAGPDEPPELSGDASRDAAAPGRVSLEKKAPEKVGKKKRKKDRKAKGGKVAAAPAGAPLGTAKAVETMFRNAIRSELDMIALAATKANIMISLNGFIISALMISGAFLFNSSPSFLVPAAVFMLTSAGSIVFALFAASPDRNSLLSSVKRGWARLRGRRPEEQHPDEGNLLIYEDRVKLEPDAYWDRMQELLRDRDEIYHKMSEHLYWLGEMASRKFKMLNISYSIFRWGLLASIVTFLLVKATLWAWPLLTGPQTVPVANMGISEFTDVYEPSAVQQLPDGRILVVEDESSRAMNLLTIAEDGTLTEDSAADLRLTRSFGRNLNDLEGLSIDGDSVYAITSHSGDSDGYRSPSREQLLRFEIQGSQAGNIASYSGLRDALDDDAELKAAITAAAGEPVEFAELNIEGLAFHRGQLMLGLRDPGAAGDRSLVLTIENPNEVFDGKAPDFGEPVLLDLQGGGIRALSYDPVLGAFLIVNEIEDANGDKVSQMWRWTGDAALAPEPLALPNLINLNNDESIDSVTIGGEDRLLIMSDDGDPKENIPAKYLVLAYDQLPAQGEPVPSSTVTGVSPAEGEPAAEPAPAEPAPAPAPAEQPTG